MASAGAAAPAAVIRTIFAFDVGREIDLAVCRRLAPDLVRAAPAALPPSSSLSLEPPPLRLGLNWERLDVGGAAVQPDVACGVYEFGAVALTFSLSLPSASLADVRAAVVSISGSARMRAAADAVLAALLRRIGGAVEGLEVADVVEEYVVVELDDAAPFGGIAGLRGEHAGDVAGILRAEAVALSEQEVELATSTHVERTPRDVVLLDWNAALVAGCDSPLVLGVIELVNVQLLEMRFLDRRIDRSLLRSYETLDRRDAWLGVLVPGSLRDAMLRLGRQRVEAAILQGRVRNTLKLVGDPYLARLYRCAAQRFGLETWNDTIREKLAALDGVHAMLHDRVSSVRLEMLEWIVIVLIAAELLSALWAR